MISSHSSWWLRLPLALGRSQTRPLHASTGSSVGTANQLNQRICRWLAWLFLGGVLLFSTLTVDYMRHSTLEEMEAGHKVAVQLLSTWIQDRGEHDLARILPKLGRVRAHEIRLWQDGQLQYVSPPSSYKPGREAPQWFSALIAPTLPSVYLPVGRAQVEIRPDPSRAVLDAWDDLTRLALPPLVLMLLALILVFRHIARELAPVAEIEQALAQVEAGQRDCRLPHYPVAELERLAQSFNRMVERLTHSEQESRDLEREVYAENLARAQLEQARREWSQELHDQLGQNLVAIGSLAQAIINHNGPSPSGQAASLIQSSAQQVHDDLRRLLTRMRQELPRLDHALQGLIEHWRQCQPTVHCQLQCSGDYRDLSEAQQVALFRLAQEALTNIARHAQAQQVTVTLRRYPSGLELMIEDDGVGFDSQQDFSGFGLAGMKERLQHINGLCHIDSQPGHGCRIHARLL